jgi:hypothetical protein
LRKAAITEGELSGGGHKNARPTAGLLHAARDLREHVGGQVADHAQDLLGPSRDDGVSFALCRPEPMTAAPAAFPVIISLPAPGAMLASLLALEALPAAPAAGLRAGLPRSLEDAEHTQAISVPQLGHFHLGLRGLPYRSPRRF